MPLTAANGVATIRADMVPFIDAHVHANSRSSDDFQRLARAGCRGILAVAGAEGGFTRAESVLDHFRRLSRVDRPRISRAGLRCWLALGVHPRGIPTLEPERLWPMLPRAWQQLGADAVGEVGLERGSTAECRALDEQLRLAKEAGLPVVVHTPRREKTRLLEQTLELLAASGMAPDRVLLDHLDEQTLELAAESGCWLGLSIHPAKIEPAMLPALLERVDWRRVIVSSDLGANPSWLYAVPAAVLALEEAGLELAVINAVVCENATRFLDGSQ